MTTTSERLTPPAGISRNAAIAGGVVLLHVAILWAMQSGLLHRAAEIIMPVEIISEFIEPPAPKVAPPPAPAPKPAPVQRTVTKAPTPPPAPRPLAIADPTPAPNAPTGVLTPPPPAPPMEAPVAEATAPVAPPAPPAAPPAPPSIMLPSSDADYLQNPRPAYPAISKRLGEQGRVIVRVYIGADGVPQRAELSKSSGYDRLDQLSISTVMRWKFVPGKRNGVPTAMPYNVPFNWVLE